MSWLAEFVQYGMKFVPIEPTRTRTSTSTVAPVIIETTADETVIKKTTLQSTFSSTTKQIDATKPAAGSVGHWKIIIVLIDVYLFLLVDAIVTTVIFFQHKKKRTVDKFRNFHSNADSNTAQSTITEDLFEKSSSMNEQATKTTNLLK